MKSYKELLNSAANGASVLKEITPEDSEALKKCILEIYKKIASLCEQNQLTIMLAGGSCLGAIRHKGYIPWDDDLDVMMPRPDYERLIMLCERGALGDEFDFRHPQGEKESSSMFLKVFYKDSLVVGLEGESQKYLQNCFLDVFTLDGYSKNKMIRMTKGIIAYGLRLIANLVLDAEPWTDEQMKFYSLDKELKRMMFVRQCMGKVFSFVDHQKWISWYDSFVQSHNMAGLVGIPAGRKLYNGEVFPANVFFPPVKAEFEGMQVNVPSLYKQYLTNLYQNYMELPPVEKHETHFIRSVSIPQKFYV